MVSERAQKGLDIPSNIKLNLLHHEDPYHAGNKEGYIKLSSADSILCANLIADKFRSINWSKFETDLLFVYPRGGGEVCTLNSLARFINYFYLLAQILFDSGDVMLVPAPYYYRFTNDFGERGLVQIKTVPALSKCGTKTELLVEQFEQAYQEGEKQGKVKGLILVNPQNPEGGYFLLDEIRPIIRWAVSRNLYVMLDEIYDLTIYDEIPGKPFQSAVQLFETEQEKSRLIWMWGLSKNFALPGLRFAALHTPNELVKTAVVRFLMHHLPNTTTQFIIREILDDHEWIEKVYLPENLKRLRAARDQVLNALERYGVPYIRPRSGFFVLADFSKYMDERTFDAERRLYSRFLEKKVLINDGESMYAPKPGWFRIVFTSVDSETLDAALKRICQVLKGQARALENGKQELQ